MTVVVVAVVLPSCSNDWCPAPEALESRHLGEIEVDELAAVAWVSSSVVERTAGLHGHSSGDTTGGRGEMGGP